MFKHWVSAARLRTLPLALATFGTGSAFAYRSGNFEIGIFGLGILTTVLLQVLSNFANDYGDYQHGADNEERLGPDRMTQKGHLSPGAMKKAIILTALLSFISGIALLYVSFYPDRLIYFFIFLGIGLASIGAAYAYTAGALPYGYKGLGDLSVFVFFGLVGVLGSYFLYSQYISMAVIAAAIGIGALSTAVLNQNNMRDLESDKAAGKLTVAVRLGLRGAKFYQLILFSFGAAGIGAALWLSEVDGVQWIGLLPTITLFIFIPRIFKASGADLDPFLKVIALHTFGVSVLIWVGFLA